MSTSSSVGPTTSHRSHSTAICQLSSGLVISGAPPEPPSTPRPSSLPSLPAPYTGGDLHRSGDLRRSGEATSSSSSRPHSGHLPRKPSSGPLSQIPPTGLITGDDPNPNPRRQQQQQQRRKKKEYYGTAVTEVEESGAKFRFAVPRAVIWVGIIAVLITLGVGILVTAVIGRFVILAAVVVGIVVVVVLGGFWNWGRGRKELERFLRGVAETGIDPRNLPVGQIVKVTGVIYILKLVTFLLYSPSSEFGKCVVIGI